ncbi:MAG: amino acid adenylation domain-containing protein [Pirellulaceae bacterium]
MNNKFESSDVPAEWNQTRRDYPQDVCIHQLIEVQALRTPEAVAVVWQDRPLTYGELNRRANRLAHHLLRLGLVPESTVGVCLERSADLVVALLGVLKAGGAYVPLDPAYPAERLAFMLSDSRAAQVITQESVASQLSERWSCAQPVLLEALSPADLDSNPPSRSNAAHLAYVIYTSGSTGIPKGVAIEHRNAVSFLHWVRDTFSDEELSGVLGGTSICFDLSVFEIFGPLSWGGRVILAQNAVECDVGSHWAQVKMINTVPSVMGVLLGTVDPPPSAVTVNLAGEPLKPALVDAIHRKWPVRRVNDLYGPTETTTYSTWTTRQPNAPATVGRPIANTQIHILDEDLSPLPVGAIGELYISGAGVARGYLHRPELTAERFLPNPFVACSQARMYRTGDLARWRADGNIEYLGRRDQQVKIRGFRIEPGEVESVLETHPELQACAVVAAGNHMSEQWLAAFVVPRSGTTLCVPSLRSWLSQKLPDYMLPSQISSLDALPLTPNGKVDRQALARFDGGETQAGSSYEAPRTELECELVAIWQAALKHDRIGTLDNFFDLGGHSLTALTVVAEIRNRLDVDVPLRWLLEHPNITELACQIVSADVGAAVATPLQRANRQRPLPMSYGQQRMWLLQQTVPEAATYLVPLVCRLAERVDCHRLQACLQTIQNRHESLRTGLVRQGDSLVQHVVPSETVLLPWREVDWWPADPEALNELLRQETCLPFDLAIAPLWRALWARVGVVEHVLVLTFHHSIVDEWSLRLLFQELERLYAANGDAGAAGLPDLSAQYADYSVWQRNYLARGDVRERQRAYWTSRVSPPPPVVELPIELPRPAQRSGRGHVHRFQLSEELVGGLRRLARRETTSLFTLMLATFQVWLHRVTGQEDIVVGTPVSHRERAEVQSLIGYFLNTLPLRTRLSRQQSFRDILVQVKRTVLDGLEHADLPFEEIAELSGIRRDGFQTPVYQVAFVLVAQGMPEFHLGPAISRAEELHTATSKHDLILNVIAEGDVWVCDLEYASDLFTADGASRMAVHWVELVRTLVAYPDEPIDCLRLPQDAPLTSDVTTLDAATLRAGGQCHTTADRQPVERVTVSAQSARSPYAAPRTKLETRLVEIWQNVLKHERVGIHDNFFYDLRGHSLLAVKMVSRIQDEFGIVMPLSLLHVNPTIHQLALAIGENRLSFSSDGQGFAADVDSKPPLFFPGWYLDLGIEGPMGRRHYVLPFPDFAASRDQCRVEFLAESCLKTLRTIQPHGPYLLAGYSLSGLVAYEMACRLQADREDVALVALVDCAAPAGLLWRAVPAAVGTVGYLFRLKFRTQLFLARGCYYVMDLAEYCWQGEIGRALRTIRSHLRRAAGLWRFKRSQSNSAASRPHLAVDKGAATPVPRNLSFGKFISHVWAYGAYRAKPYTGFVALFVSEALAANQPRPGRGWAPWARRLHEYMLRGDHSTCVTVHRAVLIEKFQECLAEMANDEGVRVGCAKLATNTLHNPKPHG